jgi:hypothetical protein
MMMHLSSRLDDRDKRLVALSPSDSSQNLYVSTMIDVPQSSVAILRTMPMAHTVRGHDVSRGR